jgi:Peptidase M15
MNAPDWCDTEQLRYYWKEPWTVPLSGLKARRFKRRLWKHGYLSPHFSRVAARCSDGTAVPRILRRPAQRQAFHLERVRHKRGDRPLATLSWYRTVRYNRSIGGASLSQHLLARASDIAESVRVALGGKDFDKACEEVYARGGIGSQTVLGGPVRHVDCRRGKARWVY